MRWYDNISVEAFLVPVGGFCVFDVGGHTFAM